MWLGPLWGRSHQRVEFPPSGGWRAEGWEPQGWGPGPPQSCTAASKQALGQAQVKQLKTSRSFDSSPHGRPPGNHHIFKTHVAINPRITAPLQLYQ